MRNIINFVVCISIIFICSLFSLKSFAYISGKILAKEDPIYCPASFVCSAPPNIPMGKCIMVGGEEDVENYAKYWVPVKVPENQAPGNYVPILTKATYHSSLTQEVVCEYKNNASEHPGTGLILKSKIEANLEASTGTDHYSWRFVGDNAICEGIRYDCPLKQKSALLVHNKNLAGIFASINSINISNQIPSSSYVSILFDDALVGCSSVKICKIDIVSQRGGIYGSVYVDMDNKMKIITVSSSYPSEVLINKIEPFNTIEIRYVNKK